DSITAYAKDTLAIGKNTGTMSAASWVTLKYTTAGIDTIYAHDAKDDTFRTAMLSMEEINKSRPTDNEYILFDFGQSTTETRAQLIFYYTSGGGGASGNIAGRSMGNIIR
ncbi:MAG: hypothetical protein ABII90_01755, partial [Bacteroidota bacterium]